MIGLTALLLAQVTTPASCDRATIDGRNLKYLQSVSARLSKLVQERRDLLAKRAELAKRSVKLAEMSSVKRGLTEEFGQSQEDLERRDVAYTARLNTIAEEAKEIIAERDEEEAQYKTELTRCGITL